LRSEAIIRQELLRSRLDIDRWQIAATPRWISGEWLCIRWYTLFSGKMIYFPVASSIRNYLGISKEHGVIALVLLFWFGSHWGSLRQF